MSSNEVAPRYDNVIADFLGLSQTGKFRANLCGIHADLTRTVDEVAGAFRGDKMKVNSNNDQYWGQYHVERSVSPVNDTSSSGPSISFFGGISEMDGSYAARIALRHSIENSSAGNYVEDRNSLPYRNLLLTFWLANGPQIDFDYIFLKNVPIDYVGFFKKKSSGKWSFDSRKYENATTQIRYDGDIVVPDVHVWENKVILLKDDVRERALSEVRSLPDNLTVGFRQLDTICGFDVGPIAIWAFVANKMRVA